ncbi:MAG: hypothetical protein EPO10_03925 [Reyranella sp.]|uniref:acyl-homoserine-lactone synthase n=1 Tax=Reyranella sp. TaxID=1929291 RepID=UPI0012150749|nr:acyl-homoserine-lactone synthase [Reyranella sp.]TAJ84396.1 MAG: hypothetical protein EPO41_28900 [Reyranella sp.]TBR30231.1 MAG: hypothetical protein EPO10_03925 [Reyranella sp.]
MAAVGAGSFRVEQLNLRDSQKCEAYFRFRSEYFGHYLGWEVLGEDGVDRDDIDAQSAHFCLIVGDGTVAGSIRVTPPMARRWMLDMRPFSDLIEHGLDPNYPRAQSAEVSRLGALPGVAGLTDDRGYTAAQALRRAAYQHSIRSGSRYWYVIAYRALIERLRRVDYLPFKIISPTVRFDPRGRTCVACLDLAEAYVRMALGDPAFLEWNNAGVPMPDLAVLMGSGMENR